MNPVAVIYIAMPIVAAFFWLSGFCFGRAAEMRAARLMRMGSRGGKIIPLDDEVAERLRQGFPVRLDFRRQNPGR